MKGTLFRSNLDVNLQELECTGCSQSFMLSKCFHLDSVMCSDDSF